MKRWHIMVLAAAAVVVALIVGGSAFYKYYIVPRYMEPVIAQLQDRVRSGDVLDSIYSEAVRFHDEGIMDDETYAEFMRTYKEYNNNAEDSARAVLEAKESEDARVGRDSSSVTAKYASSKVGVEIIQTNDGDADGKANMKYSTERTSDRIKAEDVVNAEKVISDQGEPLEAEDEDESGDEQITNAYAKLKSKMTGEEFSTFLSIMNKLDINTLRSMVGGAGGYNKEEIKRYLHSNLSEDEYKSIVNLGYKYMGVLLKDE